MAGGAVCPEAFQIFGAIPAVAIGAALLAFAFAVVCGVVALRPDRPTILVGLTVLAVAFFILPTRVHERYLYPFFALGAILAAFSWRWRIAYLVLRAHDVPEHVRRADDALRLCRQPGHRRLAGDRRDGPEPVVGVRHRPG